MKRVKGTLFLSVIVGLVLISVWAYFFDFQDLKEHLKNINVVYLGVSLLAYIGAYFIRSVRWKFLLEPIGHYSVKQTYLWSLTSNFINYLIPIRAGEAAKALMLKKSSGVPISRSLPSIFIDKFFDTIGIFLILSMLPFLNIMIVPALEWMIIILLLIFVAGIVILVGSVIAQEKIVSWIHKFFFFTPQKYQEKLFGFIEMFVEGTAIFKKRGGLLFRVVLFTIFGIVLDGLYFYLMFKAFGFDGVSFIFVFFGYTLLNLSYILPQPPAQLGSNEWLMTLIFVSGMGMNYGEAGSLMAVAHVLTGMIVITMGLMSLSIIGVKVVDLINRS